LRPRSARRWPWETRHRTGARSAGDTGWGSLLSWLGPSFPCGQVGPASALVRKHLGGGFHGPSGFPSGSSCVTPGGGGRAPVPAPTPPRSSFLAEEGPFPFGQGGGGGFGVPSFQALSSPSGPRLSGCPARLGSSVPVSGEAISRSSAVEYEVGPFPAGRLVPGRIDFRAFIHRRVRSVRLHCWSSNALSFHGLLSPSRSFLHRRLGAIGPVPGVSIRPFPPAPRSSLSGSTRDAESRSRCRVVAFESVRWGSCAAVASRPGAWLAPSPSSKMFLRR
jgi:hypothetical protein